MQKQRHFKDNLRSLRYIFVCMVFVKDKANHQPSPNGGGMRHKYLQRKFSATYR